MQIEDLVINNPLSMKKRISLKVSELINDKFNVSKYGSIVMDLNFRMTNSDQLIELISNPSFAPVFIGPTKRLLGNWVPIGYQVTRHPKFDEVTLSLSKTGHKWSYLINDDPFRIRNLYSATDEGDDEFINEQFGSSLPSNWTVVNGTWSTIQPLNDTGLDSDPYGNTSTYVLRCTASGEIQIYRKKFWSNVEIESDILTKVSTAKPAIMFRYYDTTHYYQLVLDINANKVKIQIYDGSLSTLQEFDKILNTNVWYRLKVRASGPMIFAFLDGQYLGYVYDDTWLFGDVMLHGDASGTDYTYFDWVKVTRSKPIRITLPIGCHKLSWPVVFESYTQYGTLHHLFDPMVSVDFERKYPAQRVGEIRVRDDSIRVYNKNHTFTNNYEIENGLVKITEATNPNFHIWFENDWLNTGTIFGQAYDWFGTFVTSGPFEVNDITFDQASIRSEITNNIWNDIIMKQGFPGIIHLMESHAFYVYSKRTFSNINPRFICSLSKMHDTFADGSTTQNIYTHDDNEPGSYLFQVVIDPDKNVILGHLGGPGYRIQTVNNILKNIAIARAGWIARPDKYVFGHYYVPFPVQGKLFHEAETSPMGGDVGSVVSDASASGGYARKALSTDSSGYLLTGPLEDNLPAGSYVAFYRMKVASNSSSSNIGAMTIRSVGTDFGTVYFAPDDFASDDTYQYFCINFCKRDEQDMEYRLYFYTGITDLSVDYVLLVPISNGINWPMDIQDQLLRDIKIKRLTK